MGRETISFKTRSNGVADEPEPEDYRSNVDNSIINNSSPAIMEGNNHKTSRFLRLGFVHANEVRHVPLRDEVHVHDGTQATDTDVKVNSAAFRLKDGIRGVEDESTLLRRLATTQAAG